MFFQQLTTNNYRENRIISWINETINNNKDYCLHAQRVEKLSTQKFITENRLLRKLIFNSFPFSAWKRHFATNPVINNAKGCLAFGLMVPWATTPALAFKVAVMVCTYVMQHYPAIGCHVDEECRSSNPPLKVALGGKGHSKPELGQSSVTDGRGTRV